MAPHLRQQGLQTGFVAAIEGLPGIEHGLVGRAQGGSGILGDGGLPGQESKHDCDQAPESDKNFR